MRATRTTSHTSVANSARAFFALALLGLLSLASPARAEWLQPDATYRDAQFQLRAAQRDTVGRPEDATRLDSLAVALLRLARTDDAERLFRRVIELRPGDDAAEAGLGKLALFAGREMEAESLLSRAGTELETLRDLYGARLRRGAWAEAAKLAEDVNDAGRVALLERMAQEPPYQISGDSKVKLFWARHYPVPLVRVRLNGESVLMALDTGASDLLIDPMWASRGKVTMLPGQSLAFWCGTRFAVRPALVQRLEIGGIKIERVPAGILSLRRWSVEVNPHGETVAGVIGLNLLRRFTATLDYGKHWLELAPLAEGGAAAMSAGAVRVPFELWGESELMVRGSVGGSRKLGLIVQTGIPGCGIAAPSEVFDELGIKGGTVSRLVKGAGTWLQGRPWVGVTVPGIVVGPIASDRVPGWSNAMDSSEMWRHGVRRDAILSGDFFEKARVTFDWAKREMAIER
ncbi:MAG: aspartyl protease family protein [Candidatus Eisenbacteria bacterium]